MDKYKISELLGYCIEIFEKTNILYNKTVSNPKNPSPIVCVHLSEIFTLSEKAKLYVALNEELEHYEITSLFSFFDRAYFQLKKVIEDRDQNTSWLNSEFDNYRGQHEIVVRMLKDVSI